jgi:hypothetical protein
MYDYSSYSDTFARCLPCRCDRLSTTSNWYWLLTHVSYLLVECKRVVGTQQVEFFNLCYIYRQWETDNGQYLYQCTVVTRWQVCTSGKCLCDVPMVVTPLFTVLFSWLGWWGRSAGTGPDNGWNLGSYWYTVVHSQAAKDQLKFGRLVMGHAVCIGMKYCEEEQWKCGTHFCEKMQHLRN